MEIPGENQSLNQNDLLTLLGKAEAMLQLEQQKRLILVEAYAKLYEEFNQYKESQKKPTK